MVAKWQTVQCREAAFGNTLTRSMRRSLIREAASAYPEGLTLEMGTHQLRSLPILSILSIHCIPTRALATHHTTITDRPIHHHGSLDASLCRPGSCCMRCSTRLWWSATMLQRRDGVQHLERPGRGPVLRMAQLRVPYDGLAYALHGKCHASCIDAGLC